MSKISKLFQLRQCCFCINITEGIKSLCLFLILSHSLEILLIYWNFESIPQSLRTPATVLAGYLTALIISLTFLFYGVLATKKYFLLPWLFLESAHVTMELSTMIVMFVYLSYFNMDYPNIRVKLPWISGPVVLKTYFIYVVLQFYNILDGEIDLDEEESLSEEELDKESHYESRSRRRK